MLLPAERPKTLTALANTAPVVGAQHPAAQRLQAIGAVWEVAAAGGWASADLAKVVRLSGLRNWVEHASKQVKTSLGWSQYQVRSDRAMRRHWALVQCAFACCWWAETHSAVAPDPAADQDEAAGPTGERGGKGASGSGFPVTPSRALLATGAAARAGLTGAGAVPVALLARLVR